MVNHWRQLPALIRMTVTDFADGAALGGLLGFGVIGWDLGRIGSMLATDSGAVTVVFLAQGALVFGVGNMCLGVVLREE